MAILKPIAAYDRLACSYGQIAQRRQRYLDAIDELIVERVPRGTASLLDVGAGDGRRTSKIAPRIGAKRVVLVEPSAAMRKSIPPGYEVWPEQLQQVSADAEQFDVILCLWNVLGHLLSERDCVEGLTKLCRLCAPNGVLFLDVVHRYNISECGAVVVARRWLRDLISPSWQHGDVNVHWKVEGEQVHTRGHVFTRTELRELFAGSGLRVEESLTVDYETGRTMKSACSGNLFYALRPGL